MVLQGKIRLALLKRGLRLDLDHVNVVLVQKLSPERVRRP